MAAGESSEPNPRIRLARLSQGASWQWAVAVALAAAAALRFGLAPLVAASLAFCVTAAFSLWGPGRAASAEPGLGGKRLDKLRRAIEEIPAEDPESTAPRLGADEDLAPFAKSLEGLQTRFHAAREEERDRVMRAVGQFRASTIAAIGEMSANAERLSLGSKALSGAISDCDGRTNAAIEAGRDAWDAAAAADATVRNFNSALQIDEGVAQSAHEIVAEASGAARRAITAVDGLAARTHEIGDLVEVIETIAAQASFLALNATLEAARAGQAGKSFTVVALEVKSLAAQMTEASEGMSERVASLRLAAIQAVETATAVDVSMRQAETRTQGVASALGARAEAWESIVKDCSQASKGADATMETLEAMNGSLAATEEAAAILRQAASEISHQARTLRENVDRFLLGLAAL